MRGTAYVKASTEEEADRLAGELNVNDIDFDTYSDDFDVLSVEPE